MDKIKELVFSYKLPVALTLLGIVLLGGGIFSSFSQLTPKTIKIQDLPKASLVSAENIAKDITVDISGAVKSPGVYHFEKDSRVEDAIKQSGGFTTDVNKQFVSKQLNLATKLSDGQKIYIPFQGETASALPVAILGSSTTASNPTTGAKINLNSASQTELESLPAIGAVTAAKIMTLRPYASPGELLSKKAVSKSVYEKVKELVEI